MRKIIIIAIALVLLLIENTILPYYSFKGAFPSILFVFAIAYSIVNGKWEAIFIGTISGGFQDIFFGTSFGANMLLNFLLCLLAAHIGEGILKKNRLIPVITVFVISIFKILGMSLILLLFNEKINFSTAILSAVMNTLVMFFGYKLVLATSEKYMAKERWRFR